ncbi:uncharacterized protein EI90DRAFT_1335647 [Cantharellus anzutake]|uniref:uncharacterized protein n=1 Tax=Cantharellus anzutake TaxID=1750568 RepID=UPI0019089CEA|nr:uncharacterized protein EI90DRAFT_1335647 [Cantharellus anzutake]KAF8329695.1 hypothetical protein EI90DRAFT_1335647 [Cantharellus anzutake]
MCARRVVHCSLLDALVNSHPGAMFGNKSPQIPSRRPKSHPAPGSFSSDRQPSLSSISEYIPQTSQDRDNVCNDRNGGLTGSYPGPPAANETVPCGFGSSKKSTSPFGLTFGKICKNTVLDRSKPSTSGPGSFFGTTTPYQPSADNQGFPSPCAPEGNLPGKHSAYITCEGDPGIHTHPPSGFPSTPPASSRSDQHKMIIGATRLILQTAASALNLSPIPKLGEIPNLILIWLQVYETVDDNDKNLKGLHDEIQRAYETILQPLQMWTCQTGEIPPEVVSLVKEFHSDLEEQIEQIQMLGNQKVIQRVILRTNTARKLTDVKACITRALSHFATVATTLNLLNTIRARTLETS